MLKRIGLVILWFFAGWVCGAMAAFALGLPVWLAPIVAVGAAVFAGWLSGRLGSRGLREQPVAERLSQRAPAA